MGRAAVPSGASTGEHEMLKLLYGNKKVYQGLGVEKAVNNIVNKIGPEIIGMDCRHQRGIDRAMIELDGTANKGALGANAIFAVSMASAKAAAEISGLPLYRYLGGANAKDIPVPQINILNGGQHADNNVDIQEFMIMPIGAKNFKEGFACPRRFFIRSSPSSKAKATTPPSAMKADSRLISNPTKKRLH